LDYGKNQWKDPNTSQTPQLAAIQAEGINAKGVYPGMAEKDDALTESLGAPEVTEEIVVERLYTIPLGKAYNAIRKKRAKRAVNLVKAFIIRHMKMEDETDLSLDNTLNEYLWKQGIEKPPRRVRVRATKDRDGLVKVFLVEG
jgi:large subunit ribosomal protein L31e